MSVRILCTRARVHSDPASWANILHYDIKYDNQAKVIVAGLLTQPFTLWPLHHWQKTAGISLNNNSNNYVQHTNRDAIY